MKRNNRYDIQLIQVFLNQMNYIHSITKSIAYEESRDKIRKPRKFIVNPLCIYPWKDLIHQLVKLNVTQDTSHNLTSISNISK